MSMHCLAIRPLWKIWILQRTSLRSLIGNKNEFDKLDKALFDGVVIKELLQNKYITSYGRRKINAILKGIAKISDGDAFLEG